MRIYDMHIHSRFSFDSTMTMETAAERAIALGLSGIAFTDHLDVDYTADGSDMYYDFAEYMARVTEVKAKYAGRLEILSGVEVGLQPHVVDENIRRLKGFEFDYKIGSTHLIGHIDPYDRTYFKIEPEKQRGYLRYLNEMLRNIELYDDYSAVGHFDYLIRYASFKDNTMYYSEFRDAFDALLKQLVNRGLAFEVNTRSYDKTPMDVRVLKRYRELGGETVTLGSDAHNYSRIGKGFAAAIELIKYCGFGYVAHFAGMQPVYDKL